ncbi:MAG: magnesium transporter [Phycisphaerae bacterium]
MNATSKPDLSRSVREFAQPVETALSDGQTIGEALASLHARQINHKVIYFYVVDRDGKLVGVIPTRKLLLSDPLSPVRSIMEHSPISIPDSMTLEEAMEMFAMHRLLAFPVVDARGMLVGHIDIDLYAEEAFDVSESQRSAELFQLIGLSVERPRRPSAWAAYMMRTPWLMCNVAGGIACAVIAAALNMVLAKAVIIAMFIPLVLTLSESISMQAMTLALQQLRMAKADLSELWKLSLAELKTAGMVALTCGAVVGLAASFWGHSVAAGAIAAGIVLSMVAAASLGATAPVLLHILRLDPKVAGGPVVLMIGDVVTMAIYLGIAAWLV